MGWHTQALWLGADVAVCCAVGFTAISQYLKMMKARGAWRQAARTAAFELRSGATCGLESVAVESAQKDRLISADIEAMRRYVLCMAGARVLAMEAVRIAARADDDEALLFSLRDPD